MSKIYLNSQGRVITDPSGNPIKKVNLETYNSAPLPAEAKTFKMKTGTLGVSVSPYIKIVDASFNSWTVEQWHEDASARGFVKDGVPAPIGFDIEAWGKHFIFYMRTKASDPAGASKTYYDVTGSVAQSDGCLRHSAYQHTMDVFANPGSSPTVRRYTINGVSVDASATAVGDTVELTTSNSPFKWTIKKGLTSKNAFDTDNAKDRFDALLAYTEFYRVLAARNSGIQTSAPDGSIGKVTIKNASGDRPTPVTDEMYFWINGTNTNILAKYNITGDTANNGIFGTNQGSGGDNLTQAMADTIYLTQKNNGVTMNDSYDSSVAKVIVTEGAKGAEAYAYNGYWYITTPVLSRGNGTTLTLEYNIPDSPALSWIQWYNSQFKSINTPYFFMPDERMLSAVRVNRPTCLNSIRTYLNSAQGEAWGLPAFSEGYNWSVVRGSASYAWDVYFGYGFVYTNNTFNRFAAPCVSALN